MTEDEKSVNADALSRRPCQQLGCCSMADETAGVENEFVDSRIEDTLTHESELVSLVTNRLTNT